MTFAEALFTAATIGDERRWLFELEVSLTAGLGPGTLLYRAARRMGVSVKGATLYRDMVLCGISRINAYRVARLIPPLAGELPYPPRYEDIEAVS